MHIGRVMYIIEISTIYVNFKISTRSGFDKDRIKTRHAEFISASF